MQKKSKHIVLRTVIGVVFVLSSIGCVLDDTNDCLSADSYNTQKRCELTNCPVCGTMSLLPHALQIGADVHSEIHQDYSSLQGCFQLQLHLALKEEQASDLTQFQYPVLHSHRHTILRV